MLSCLFTGWIAPASPGTHEQTFRDRPTGGRVRGGPRNARVPESPAADRARGPGEWRADRRGRRVRNPRNRREYGDPRATASAPHGSAATERPHGFPNRRGNDAGAGPLSAFLDAWCGGGRRAAINRPRRPPTTVQSALPAGVSARWSLGWRPHYAAPRRAHAGSGCPRQSRRSPVVSSSSHPCLRPPAPSATRRDCSPSRQTATAKRLGAFESWSGGNAWSRLGFDIELRAML